jgi:hypothetical protein
MGDLFAAWTAPAILTAILSGLAFGLVVHRLRPLADHRIVGFLSAVLLAFWYAPQAARLWAMPDGPDPIRTVSVWLLATVWFVIPAWLTLRWFGGRGK